MRLNINDDSFIETPAPKAIQKAIKSLLADQFVVLSLDDEHYIQAFYHEDGTYELEYRDGSPDKHFAADPAETSASVVLKAFGAFVGHADGWQLPWKWEKVEFDEPNESEQGEYPETFLIAHDEYHAKHIGRTADGNQFFLTTPFVPAGKKSPGCEYIALFLFAPDGKLVDARIDKLGPRSKLDKEVARRSYEKRLASLGDVEFGNIEVAPFQVERFGTTFGLIPRERDEEDDALVIELHPGNCMAFYHPWNGDYDT